MTHEDLTARRPGQKSYTPATRKDLKSGARFVVRSGFGDHSFPEGAVVEMTMRDDGTNRLLFSLVDSSPQKSQWVFLGDLEAICGEPTTPVPTSLLAALVADHPKWVDNGNLYSPIVNLLRYLRANMEMPEIAAARALLEGSGWTVTKKGGES